MSYKQVIVIRKDLQMGKGKLAVQTAHASLGAYLKADKKVADKWFNDGQAKIAVSCNTEDELLDLHAQAVRLGVPASLITDAARTTFQIPTRTAVGIGPAPTGVVDQITAELKLI